MSVNPFKRLPLYTPSVIDDYAHKGKRTLPPHVFNIAEESYRGMVEVGQNQSILIRYTRTLTLVVHRKEHTADRLDLVRVCSGESGAGKTEATKQCLMFFAEVAGSTSGVEQNILLANPILEAFGNAKTLRNNNSSRFGKLISVHFDQHHRICGATTINYLLEKSRVAYQLQGERNFHVFYQLLAGADDAMRSEFGLTSPHDFEYLNRSGCIEVDDVDDAHEFSEMREAMERLNFSHDEIYNVFRLVAAVLHLGNLQFRKGSGRNVDSASVENEDELKWAAHLLEVSTEKLEYAVTFRTMDIRGQQSTSIPLNPQQAKDATHALAKQIYSKLFDWLVERINVSMVPPKKIKTSVISVLVRRTLSVVGFLVGANSSHIYVCIGYLWLRNL